jgi:hypothetical protein
LPRRRRRVARSGPTIDPVAHRRHLVPTLRIDHRQQHAADLDWIFLHRSSRARRATPCRRGGPPLAPPICEPWSRRAPTPRGMLSAPCRLAVTRSPSGVWARRLHGIATRKPPPFRLGRQSPMVTPWVLRRTRSGTSRSSARASPASVWRCN